MPCLVWRPTCERRGDETMAREIRADVQTDVEGGQAALDQSAAGFSRGFCNGVASFPFFRFYLKTLLLP